MSGKAVLENVRRYRTIASLYRQTAAFRPDQKWSLLAQAFEYERLARTDLRDTLLFATIRCGGRWQPLRRAASHPPSVMRTHPNVEMKRQDSRASRPHVWACDRA